MSNELESYYLAQETAVAKGPTDHANVSAESPVKFNKDLISTGNFKVHGTGKGINVNEEQMAAIISDTNRYLANGNKIEFVADHSGRNSKPLEKFKNEKENRSVTNIGGYCGNFTASNGWASCDIDMTTKGGVELATSTKDVSIELYTDYEDTKGNKYPSVIRRVAAVQKPVVTGQKGYVALSQYFSESENTYVKTQNKNEDTKMDDLTITEEDKSIIGKMKAFFASQEPEPKDDVDPVALALAKANKKLEEQEELLKAEQQKTKDTEVKLKTADGKNDANEKAGIVALAKDIGKRIKDLGVDKETQDGLAVALGIEEGEEVNAIYLSQEGEDKSHADVIVSLFENAKTLKTKATKKVDLSQYHGDDKEKEEELQKEILAEAKKSRVKMNISTVEDNK